MSADLAALKAYVQHDTGIQNRSEDTVAFHVTHSNLKAQFMEVRFDLHMTVLSVKEKLRSHVGTNASSMRLHLKTFQGQLLASNLEDGRMLGFYSPTDGMILHVVDDDPFSLSKNGGLEDVSKVDKYVMSEDEYNKRDNTYRKFKEAKLAEDPNWTLQREMAKKRGVELPEKISDEEHMAELAGAINVEARCEVNPGGRRGSVRYVGKVEGLPLGYWVGVEYDEPLGKNDGSVKGKRYFQCADGFGAMVRPDKVTVGDFPNIGDELFGSDEEL